MSAKKVEKIVVPFIIEPISLVYGLIKYSDADVKFKFERGYYKVLVAGKHIQWLDREDFQRLEAAGFADGRVMKESDDGGEEEGT